jgi:hypothetical protein
MREEMSNSRLPDWHPTQGGPMMGMDPGQADPQRYGLPGQPAIGAAELYRLQQKRSFGL